MSITIVPMSQEHIEGIAQIEKECFSKPWSLNSIKEELTNPTAMFFAATDGDTVAGYAGMNMAADECYMSNIGVLPTYRGKGIANALLDTCIGTAGGMMMKFISLEVRPSNKIAVDMYKNHGFKICGRRKAFYSNPKEDGYIMTLNF